MYFPKFWASGECEGQISWRWSDRSFEDALALACAAAEKVAERIRRGDIPQRGHGYYPGRPFREPVIQELTNSAGDVEAVVTRNSYGTLVLNTARAMFVDVDLPQAKPAGFFKKLFGDAEPPGPHPMEARVISNAEAWAGNRASWGWRVYRTRAGLRLLASHSPIEPEADMVEMAFEALGADPLYRRLCASQKCFRARLTPKPWRCGVARRPERWPFPNAIAEARFEKWEARYRETCSNWATCDLICRIGNRDIHPALQAVIGTHDKTTRAESKLPLA